MTTARNSFRSWRFASLFLFGGLIALGLFFTYDRWAPPRELSDQEAFGARALPDFPADAKPISPAPQSSTSGEWSKNDAAAPQRGLSYEEAFGVPAPAAPVNAVAPSLEISNEEMFGAPQPPRRWPRRFDYLRNPLLVIGLGSTGAAVLVGGNIGRHRLTAWARASGRKTLRRVGRICLETLKFALFLFVIRLAIFLVARPLGVAGFDRPQQLAWGVVLIICAIRLYRLLWPRNKLSESIPSERP